MFKKTLMVASLAMATAYSIAAPAPVQETAPVAAEAPQVVVFKNLGAAMAASTPKTTITTTSSMTVNPLRLFNIASILPKFMNQEIITCVAYPFENINNL